MSAVLAQSIPQRKMRWRPYVAAVLLIPVIGFVGFWRTYFGPLVATGTVDTTWMIHVHAIMCVVWFAALVAQVSFAATGRLALHVRLGPWVMGLVAALLAYSLVLGLVRFGERVTAGQLEAASRQVFGPFRETLFIGPVIAAGWIWRRKPEVHKRLMLVIAALVVMPAIGRMVFLGRPVPEWKFLLIWASPLYLAMAHDLIKRRLVHPVYLVGLGIMLAMRLALPLRLTQAWLDFTAWLASWYA
jgi:hypothetical protein